MKLILLCLLCVLTGTIKAQSGILSFETKEIRLPDLKADDIPTVVSFKVKNTGKQPVLISRVIPVTPRMTAEWDKSPILPGKTSEIQISFVSANIKPEKFDYTINVQSNAQNSREQLRISSNIVDNPGKPTLLYQQNLGNSGIKFKSISINLGNIYPRQILKDTLWFYNTRDKAVTISTRYIPNHIRAEAFPQTVAAGEKGMLVLTYDAAAKNDYGHIFDSVILKFDDDNSYNNRLSVVANIVEDFSQLTEKELADAPVVSFDKKSIEFGEIKPGEKANCDFTLENQGKSALIIRKTKASCGCTAVTMGENTILPGQKTIVRATFNSAGKSGRQYKSITVITNDPKNPETILTISGTIK